MKLRIKDGQLSYGSTYRLLVTCWICGVGSFFMAMLLLVFAVMMIVGTGEVNGEAIAGRGALIAGILPMFVLSAGFCCSECGSIAGSAPLKLLTHQNSSFELNLL